MVRQLGWLLVLGCLVSLAGCGKSNDSLVEEMLSNMNDMSAALEAGDKEKFKAVVKKMSELAAQTKGKKDTVAENKRMEEKYKGKLEAAMKRLQAATQKAMTSGKFTPQDMMEIQSSMIGAGK